MLTRHAPLHAVGGANGGGFGGTSALGSRVPRQRGLAPRNGRRPAPPREGAAAVRSVLHYPAWNTGILLTGTIDEAPRSGVDLGDLAELRHDRPRAVQPLESDLVDDMRFQDRFQGKFCLTAAISEIF